MWLYLHHLKGRLNCYFMHINLCCGQFSEILFHLELLLLQFICLFVISPVVYHDLSSTSYVHVMSCHILPAPQHPPQRSGVEVTPVGRRWCRGRPELNQPTNQPWQLHEVSEYLRPLLVCAGHVPGAAWPKAQISAPSWHGSLQASSPPLSLPLQNFWLLSGAKEKNAPKWSNEQHNDTELTMTLQASPTAPRSAKRLRSMSRGADGCSSRGLLTGA